MNTRLMKKYIPKKGVKVRDPKTGGHIPEEGAVRVVDSYLTRRVNEGDLTIEDVKKQKSPTKKAKDTQDKGVK